jgi:hypothetical protein
MIDAINSVILHPYVLAIYGVLLWQVEQWFTSKKPIREFYNDANRNIGRSLIWVGVVVVFDDELLAKYNEWAAMDYHEMPLYMYTIAGFFIDFIRSRFTKLE